MSSKRGREEEDDEKKGWGRRRRTKKKTEKWRRKIIRYQRGGRWARPRYAAGGDAVGDEDRRYGPTERENWTGEGFQELERESERARERVYAARQNFAYGGKSDRIEGL